MFIFVLIPVFLIFLLLLYAWTKITDKFNEKIELGIASDYFNQLISQHYSNLTIEDTVYMIPYNNVDQIGIREQYINVVLSNGETIRFDIIQHKSTAKKNIVRISSPWN